MSVERWAATSHSEIYDSEDGDFVLHSDYEKLESENARLREAILTWWHGAPTDAGSEQQLCDVAAELENTD